MSMFWCDRCDRRVDSDYVDAVQDPTDETEMICDRCLTDDEIDEINEKEKTK